MFYLISLAYPKKKKKKKNHSKFKWSAFNNLYLFLKKLLKRISSRAKERSAKFQPAAVCYGCVIKPQSWWKH